MISSSISYLLRDLTDGIVNPILMGLLGGDSKLTVQIMDNKVEIDWKKLVSSILSLLFNLILAFFIVRWSLSSFPNDDRKPMNQSKRAAAVNATQKN